MQIISANFNSASDFTESVYDCNVLIIIQQLNLVATVVDVPQTSGLIVSLTVWKCVIYKCTVQLFASGLLTNETTELLIQEKG